jgi:hypothetical protein
MPEFLISLVLAEKGGSRTLRGPYDPQTGFEDQRHHRAPSFSFSKINYLRLDLFLPCPCYHPVTIRKPSQRLPFADPDTSCAYCTEVCPEAFMATQSVKAVFL